MKIFCVTRGHVPRMRTHHILKTLSSKWDIQYVTHTEEDAERVREVTGFKTIVNGIPNNGDLRNMVRIRDFVLTQVEKGEPYFSIDDNITMMGFPTQEEWDSETLSRYSLRRHATPEEIERAMEMLIDRCLEEGTNYGGFGWLENPFFARKKWQINGYVKGKFFLHWKDDVPFQLHPDLIVMSDHCKTFDTIARYGKTVVLRWLYVDHPQFEQGGIGSHAERLPGRVPSCQLMESLYDGLITLKDSDKPQLRSSNLNFIAKWRQNNYDSYMERIKHEGV